MKLLKAYQYLFYKLYRFYETSMYSKWWSEWKAYVSMLALSIWFYLALETSYYYYFDIPVSYSDTDTYLSILVFGSIIAVINWLLFEHQDKWKNIVSEFDKLPKKNNRIGGVVVWAIIISIIVFYWFYSISLLSKLNYK